MDVALYRARIGAFAPILQFRILVRKAKIAKGKVKVLVIRGYCDAVLMACLATYLFWGSLLTRCGDVELNPGPGDTPATDKQVKNRQTPWTRLQSANAAKLPTPTATVPKTELQR
jgi:hypothetical protein